MAKYGKTLAQVIVEINGKQQVQQVLKAMEESAERLRAKIKSANSELEVLAQGGSSPEYDAKKREISGMSKELSQLERAMKETKKVNEDIGAILGNMSDYTATSLNKAKRSLSALLNSIVPDTKKAQKQIETIQKAIKLVSDEIEHRKGKLVEFSDIMDKLGKATPEQLDQVERRLESLLRSVTKNSNAWRKYNKELRLVREEKGRRLESQATDIMSGDYTKTIEGTKEAIEVLKKYQQTLAASDTGNIEKITIAIKQMTASLDETARLKAAKVMKNPFAFSVEEINEAIKVTEKLQASEPDVAKWSEYAEQISEATKARDKFAADNKYKVMSEQFDDLSKLSVNALSEQKKYWESMRDSGQYYDEAIDKLKQIKALENSRISSDAQSRISQVLSGGFDKTNEETREAIKLIEQYKNLLSTGNVDAIKDADKAIEELNRKLEKAKLSSFRDVIGNPDDYSTEQIKEAVDWLTKYRNTLSISQQDWKDLGVEIQKANEYMDNAKATEQMTLMLNKFGALRTMSDAALSEQKKYWQDVIANTDRNNTQLAVYQNNLKDIIAEERRRKDSSAGWTMSHLSDSSVEQIREAIKATEELRDSVKRSDPDWNIYNSRIEDAKNYLQEFETNAKKASSLKVASNLGAASVSEMKQTIDFLTKYRDTLTTVSPEYSSITKAIDDTTNALKEFNEQTKMDAMNKQMINLNSLSKSALEEQKKYWQGVYDSAQKTSQAWADAKDNLVKIKQEENTRLKSEASNEIGEALSGYWNKTIEETEEAIKLIQEYKKQLRVNSDAPTIENANKALEELNRRLDKTKELLMDVDIAKEIGDKLGEGTFDGTTEDIEKARKSLEEYRKTLKLDNVDELKKVDKALNNIRISADLGGKNLKDLNKVLGDLKHASMDDLQAAAKRLQNELQGATRGVKEYSTTAAQLRRVNRELERARKEWEGQESLFVRMTKRLTVYMAAYGSLSFIVDKVKELGKSNLQLSDSIADVAKTTGLEAKELARLGSEIRAIDTRTTQEQLYELAAAAGQLGIKSETEIAGFVRAANMITVSLNELGTEATTQLMKIATLTGEAQKGTEKALLSIGSAINELTANSAAAAGPIVDLMNRMGGIAAQSGITSAQMAAIGATADALGQSVEITGTSMNKFLATLMSSSDQVAYALNMDANALRSFINEGRTMDAVVAVFERMNDMGGLGRLAPVMGSLGSEGARMIQVLTAMAERVDFLKGQLDISTQAYNDAISIQNEYNVKNENAIAILQRMGNAIKELFVNNMVVDGVTEVLRAMYNFFSYLKEWTAGAKLLVAAITAVTAALVANRIEWIKNLQVKYAAFFSFSAKDQLQLIAIAMQNFTKAIKTNIIALKNWVVALFTTRKAVDSVSLAWKKFTKFLSTNWLTITIAAVAGLVAWIIKLATYVSEAAKATAEYNRQLQEETDKVDQLFRSLNRLSSKEEERARIINQINQQYGQYLGFMLDEKDSAEKLAATHKLINAELRKRMSLNLQTALTGKATNEYAEKLEKTIADIGTKLENVTVGVVKEDGSIEKKELYTSDVMRTVSEIINDRVYDAVKVTQEEVNGEIIYKQQFEGVDIGALKKDIKEALQKQYSNVIMFNNAGLPIYGDDTYTGTFINSYISGYIEDLLNERVAYQKKVITAEQQANIELRSATKATLKARNDVSEQLKSEIDNSAKKSEDLEKSLSDADKKLKAAKSAAEKYSKDDESKEAKNARANLRTAEENYAKEERKLKDHYEKMVDNADDYVSNLQQTLKDHYSHVDAMEDGEQKEQLKKEKEQINKQIKIYTDLSKEAAKKVPGFDPWDKERDVKDWREFSEIVTNLDTSSAKALAAAFKKIKDEAALFPDDVKKVYELFQAQGVDKISLEKLGLTDAKSVAEVVFKWETQIRDKLKNKFHRNTTLGFIFDEGSDRDMKTQVRQEYQAAMAALEAYYKEYEDFYRQRKEELDLTDETLNQQILENDRKFNEDRQQLIKKFLGEESTFDQTKYIGVLSGYDYFGKKDLEKMSKQYQQFGDAMTDGGRNQIAKSGLKVSEAINKEKQKIYNLLADKQYIQKAVKEMQDAFESLNIVDDNGNSLDNYLWGNTPTEKRTQEAAAERMKILQTFSEDVYSEEAESFKKRLLQDKVFGSTVSNMNEEQYAAFLILLQQYHDKVISAEKQYADERKRIIDQQWEDEGYANGYDAADRTIAIAEENLITMQNANAIAYEQEYFDQYQQLVLNRVALEQWAYEQRLELYKKNSATQEQFQQLDLEHAQTMQQFQQQLLDNYISRYQKMADVTTSYGNIIGDGFGRMIAGEEDAGKQLIKNLLTETIQMASQFAQRLILQSTFGAQMESIRATQNAAQLTAAYATAMSEVGIEASKMAAIEAIAAGEITAQSMSQPDSIVTWGSAGAARAAVIIGLVAAATAAALALVNSMFPESKASSTTNRKLSTGMLTYADGNYPVLGNDGKVYDAKYEGAGMKTGIYGGGAHFGIFSEKQPEMIVDGKTTQKLILNYPYIYDAITTIAKNGRLVNAMPTFASGDYPAGMQRIAQVEAVDVSGGSNEQMDRMSAALEQSQEVNRQLLKLLQGGITAHLDGLETHRQQKKNERFLKRRGID